MSQVIEFLAVVSSALYGILLARRHQMDFVGIFCLALIVSFGGGTLRDLFLGRHPLFWIENDHYPVIVFVLALVPSFFKSVPERVEKYLSIPDALGLGLFSIMGVSAALESGTSLFIAALLGAVTGTFGGVMGDVICNRVPSLFRPAPMFATCSFTGNWIFIALNSWPQTQKMAAPMAISFIVIFRLLAIRFQLRLPHVEVDSIEPGTHAADSTRQS